MVLEERSPSDWRPPGGQKCSRFRRDTPILTSYDAFKALMGLTTKSGRNTMPQKPDLNKKKVEMLAGLKLDLDEFYRES